MKTKIEIENYGKLHFSISMEIEYKNISIIIKTRGGLSINQTKLMFRDIEKSGIKIENSPYVYNFKRACFIERKSTQQEVIFYKELIKNQLKEKYNFYRKKQYRMNKKYFDKIFNFDKKFRILIFFNTEEILEFLYKAIFTKTEIEKYND